MSVSAVAPVSISELAAVYTERNYATAVSFAAQPPARNAAVPKDIRAEDEANRDAVRKMQRVSESAPPISFRRDSNREQGKQKKRNGKFASFDKVLQEEDQPSFDSYA